MKRTNFQQEKLRERRQRTRTQIKRGGESQGEEIRKLGKGNE